MDTKKSRSYLAQLIGPIEPKRYAPKKNTALIKISWEE